MGSFDSVGVIDVLVKPGDTVDFDSPLVTLETDKATMDVPSTAKGVMEKVHVAKGGKLSPGSVVVTVKGHAAAAAPAKAAAAVAAPGKAAAPPPARDPRHRREYSRLCPAPVACPPSTKPASSPRTRARPCASSRASSA